MKCMCMYVHMTELLYYTDVDTVTPTSTHMLYSSDKVVYPSLFSPHKRQVYTNDSMIAYFHRFRRPFQLFCLNCILSQHSTDSRCIFKVCFSREMKYCGTIPLLCILTLRKVLELFCILNNKWDVQVPTFKSVKYICVLLDIMTIY